MMIAKLTGTIDSKGLDSLILDVHGVGYQIFVSAKTLAQISQEEEKVSFLIETVLRNEQPFLCGFLSPEEQECFRLLLSVQGVGAKVALAIQSVLSMDQLREAIALQDKALICRADGVGPKVASRIIMELKEKVGSIPMAALASSSAAHGTTGGNITHLNTALGDAISALQNLGYRRPDVIEAVAKVSRELGPEANVDSLIRLGLQHLSKTAGGYV